MLSLYKFNTLKEVWTTVNVSVLLSPYVILQISKIILYGMLVTMVGQRCSVSIPVRCLVVM